MKPANPVSVGRHALSLQLSRPLCLEWLSPDGSLFPASLRHQNRFRRSHTSSEQRSDFDQTAKIEAIQRISLES